MKSSWLENKGNGKFEMHALPTLAQLAPIYGILPMDINEDNFLDILLVGNDYGMEVQQGRADAFIGLALLNDGQGGFKALTMEESHFYVPGDAKSLTLINVNNEPLILSGQNQDYLKVFQNYRLSSAELLPVSTEIAKTKIHFQDDSQRLMEFYWGNTFQSQSGRFVIKTEQMKDLQFFNAEGQDIEITN
jgi:hypothetical protein